MKAPPTDLIGPLAREYAEEKLPDTFRALFVAAMIRAAAKGRHPPSPAACSVWLYLKEIGGRGGVVRCGIRELARRIERELGPTWRMNRDTLAVHLDELVMKRWLRSELRHRKGSTSIRVFQVADPAGLPFRQTRAAAKQRKAEKREKELSYLRSTALLIQANEPDRFNQIRARVWKDMPDADWRSQILPAIGRIIVSESREPGHE